MTPPVTTEQAALAARVAIEHGAPYDIEVTIAASNTGLTRYAGSKVIQNIVRQEKRLYVRAAVDSRTASATTTQVDDTSMRRTVERAIAAAKVLPPDDDFPGFADPAKVGRARGLFRWDETTARVSAGERARAVKEMLRAAGAMNAAGVVESSAHAYAVFSSSGIDCYDAFTKATASCLVDTGESSGWGEGCSHALGTIDLEDVARRAASKAVMARGATDAAPGTYEVVLEPTAVATLLEYLAWVGFGAKQLIEGDSFLATHAGDVVAAPAVTVADDTEHALSLGIGFDFEGVPKERVPVVDNGRATRPVTDLRTGRLLGLPSSGHFSGSNEYGPYASNLVLEAGTASSEDLVGGVSDGLLVTRFHYVNVLERPSTLLTGMTRDGTFRIRSGEIAEPIHNLRFTQGALEALRSVVAVGADLVTSMPEFSALGSTVAPALRVGAFNFSSTTSH